MYKEKRAALELASKGGGQNDGFHARGEVGERAKLVMDAENPFAKLKDIDKLYGIARSDIDKYSRIVFPVYFTCFQLMYWVIYLHISNNVEDDLVLLEKPD